MIFFNINFMARTTVDIDTPVLRDLKRIQKKEKKSLGRLVSDLLAEALVRRQTRRRQSVRLRWTSQDMRALVDITDKEMLYAALDKPKR